jgi:hypothetical protein
MAMGIGVTALTNCKLERLCERSVDTPQEIVR